VTQWHPGDELPFPRPYQWELDDWHPASGHPGGWRVVRVAEGRMEELSRSDGHPILFPTYTGAERRAKQMRTT